MEPETIGERIRACRRFRGMTLQELADLSGLSKGFLSMVENGRRTLDRRSHLDAVANALQVSLSEITGKPYLGTPRMRAVAQAAVPALRLTLMDCSLEDPPDVPSRPLPVVAEEVRKAERLQDRCDYVALGRPVCELLPELHVMAANGPREERAEALRLLIQASHFAQGLLTYLGYEDLAWVAAERAREAAKALAEPGWAGMTEFLRCQALMWAKGRSQALSTAVRAADRLTPHLDDEAAAESYGMLHLTAALASAALSQGDAARDHLAEAARIADRTGERGSGLLGLGFGPTNVGMWRVSVELELGDPERAVEAAHAVSPERLPLPRRQAMYYADVGRALAKLPGKQREAVQALRTAERLAPQRVHASPIVRDTVAMMLNRARAQAGGRDLRGLAYRMGIPH
ncbi:hypothetical protein TH66_12925 [Carbonactinospora thermoautotrophica]|uniref:Putative transcriptional regulator n=2 Tax=Carbonactinospora thermoautotrophica TaxID=1469144 RepID=A0A132MXR8_9ACTN|nr:helix-turn-helix transcriptional regulator [Carbonactinospora thermoautotrophica]KWX02649.1 putative transcriptional regulator [Carbonactinospora thermoautotrophica]KWX03700.1 hypothetical protein TH66_12925 [Carbonactinospora thermoautotrophica]